ncbi:MAG: orotate phosphoribosyltransferase [Bacillota bacterium]|uniref:Orotate phosphoribosyltransferase n=1 Tax=Virgibacillus salarius TaxID=447199 RepID=A0A941I994_9BACI|nr:MULTISPECIES: orotate phosphoribosyltransferase [Bacillaceae]NAZ08018.1 orotate phosphoribosyltransferase [Agaribacter marinus]MBR7795303.1 orotate phosphoribosyltransferase [Virgibacillus salarius]MCC2252526.1 orotate phosphoribosyltransferase [Virgibacillus sp. AGTR]MDY7045620.1 orotate phosphoribosyltransferase [Virgibacillus sp. M23]QRZ16902.1 orotate phosphoribosyltransferase [Virgibacillus sp. AGTR]
MQEHDHIVRELLRIKAVQIKTDGYFTWTSGIQSPIYCDNRLTMSYPEVRKQITTSFIKRMNDLQIKPDMIAGCATAGIPHAAWLADELNLPMIYVRSKPKGHGKGNQIEGELESGKQVLVIEDLISTGGSSIEAAQAIEKNGGKVCSVFAIFTYGLATAETAFTEAGFSHHTITGFDQLVNALLLDKEITENEKQKLLKWREDLGKINSRFNS